MFLRAMSVAMALPSVRGRLGNVLSQFDFKVFCIKYLKLGSI